MIHASDQVRVDSDPKFLVAALDTRLPAVIEFGVDGRTPVVIYAGDARTVIAPRRPS